jgi:curved DNA-binding protein CbpA
MENLGAAGPLRPPAPSAPPPPVSEAEPEAPAKASTDEKQLADAVEKRFQDVSAGKDYFALLGVSRESNRDEVKAAFLQLAKVFHPDRLPPTLNHLSTKITAVFEAIREGYEVLQTDAKRAAYVKALVENSSGARQPTKAEAEAEAQEFFKKGEALFRKKDFAAAEQEYEKAQTIAPQPVYLAARAWAIYMDPARKSEAAQAKQMILDALRSDPKCARAHYQLGVIARVEGDVKQAEKHFRYALDADPKHLEASQELRVIEMRKKKGFSFR